tara:strand:- start:2767 stop:4245 length:1479 start_codon:yes stop_codon:yes gene_type:complete
MATTGTLTSNSPGLVPAPKKGTALNSNYLQFTDKAGDDFSSFAQQYLPELYEAEVERYGNRTIGGFLRMVGAEMPMTSDQVIWSEQNRLHVGFSNCTIADADEINIDFEETIINPIKVGQLVLIQGGEGDIVAEVTEATPTVTPAANGTIKVKLYEYTSLTAGAPNGANMSADDKCTVFVFGSEYRKGSNDDAIGTLVPSFTQFSNKPVIIRDRFEVNGSDTAQIGWVEVATEDGTSGYLWYLKAESETRLRFEDYMEMMMVEAVKKNANGTTTNSGTEGLFAAIKDRGQVMDGYAAGASGTTAVEDFDEILKQLDKEGAIEENMLFLNRDMALTFDDMLAKQMDSGAGGTGYGLFNNDGDMALNLGFSGFRRGSYDFYKTDWKYLNDASTRGIVGLGTFDQNDPADLNVEGILVPAGTSTVYDQLLGQNIRRPFLHVRYRASEADDRRMKSWVTGSIGGAFTTGLDAMIVHFLSERCLCVQGANNFVLFRS